MHMPHCMVGELDIIAERAVDEAFEQHRARLAAASIAGWQPPRELVLQLQCSAAPQSCADVDQSCADVDQSCTDVDLSFADGDWLEETMVMVRTLLSYSRGTADAAKRRIRLGNAAFEERVWRHHCARTYMGAAGWTVQGKSQCI